MPLAIYTVRLPDEMRDALAELRERDGMPASEAIRRGLVAFLKDRGIAVKPAKGGKRPKRRSK